MNQEWANYGDVSVEHGQVWVYLDTETTYRIVRNDFDYDAECYYIRDLYVDISDDWIDQIGIEAYCDVKKEAEPIQYAIGATDYHNDFGILQNSKQYSLKEVTKYFMECNIPIHQ